MANNALPLDLIIDVTSTGVRDTFTIGKLNTIIIEKYDTNFPNKSHLINDRLYKV